MSERNSSADQLVHKADALIRRHRSFVARPHGYSPEPPVIDAAAPSFAPEDDIPVLTDIISDPDSALKTAQEVVSLALTDQQIAIRAAIERWVDESLPDAMLHVLDGFTDRLIAAVCERARADLLDSLQRDLGAGIPVADSQDPR